MLILLPGDSLNWTPHVDSRLFGFLLTPRRIMSKRLWHIVETRDAHWAIDNECFTQGKDFDFARFARFVERAALYPGRCLFVSVPDVVGNARATHERWMEYAPMLRAFGLPLAYVAQDGLDELPAVAYDTLFIGGSTEYKLSRTTARLIREAKANSKWVHVGRVNSIKRLRYSRNIGADSVDGTGVRFRPKIYFPLLHREQSFQLHQRRMDLCHT